MSVKVSTSPHGYLRLRVYWNGAETTVGTDLRDTEKARARLLGRAALIDEKLEAGAPLHRALLDVLGTCPPRLLPDRGIRDLTVEIAARGYIDVLKTKGPRASHLRKATAYVEAVIIPYFGKTRLLDLDEKHVHEFQQHVLGRKTKWSPDDKPRTIATKTARNIVAGHFAAILRYTARRYMVPERNLLVALEWPEIVRDDPNPFTSEERDAIIGHFEANQASWAPWVAFLFWTGMRPSEAAGLRLGDVDLAAGTVSIARSLSEGAVGATKTRLSRRTIALFPEALAALRALPARPWSPPDEPLFRDRGEQVDHEQFTTRHFYPALARLTLRKRKFYATRHTFVSWLIGQGEDLKAIAEYVGTSVTMIERNYGRWLPKGSTAGVSSLRSIGESKRRDAEKPREREAN